MDPYFILPSMEIVFPSFLRQKTFQSSSFVPLQCPLCFFLESLIRGEIKDSFPFLKIVFLSSFPVFLIFLCFDLIIYFLVINNNAIYPIIKLIDEELERSRYHEDNLFLVLGSENHIRVHSLNSQEKIKNVDLGRSLALKYFLVKDRFCNSSSDPPTFPLSQLKKKKKLKIKK